LGAAEQEQAALIRGALSKRTIKHVLLAIESEEKQL